MIFYPILNGLKKTISDWINNPFPQKTEGYVGQIEAITAFDLTDRLSKIETPLLIIAGEEDLYTPPFQLRNATFEASLLR